MHLDVPTLMAMESFVFAFAGMVLFLASLFRLQNSARRSGYAVLWLRRFHRRQQKPFQRALERACMFVGMPPSRTRPFVSP